MKAWLQFVQSLPSLRVEVQEANRPVVKSYADSGMEYRELSAGGAVTDRSYRGVLEVKGPDRAAWLNNLVTNQVKNVPASEGRYAYALNVQGRILFDLNILVRAESIWLDLDRRFLGLAKKHFEKYTISEQVEVVDQSYELVRLALAGPRALAFLRAEVAADLDQWPALRSGEFTLADVTLLAFRHDFCGVFGLELFVPANRAVELWNWLTDTGGPLAATPVGDDAVQTRRIEAGLPWPGAEITDEVLPAETDQLPRAVNMTKGCYLGQEVVERMRARGALARRLIGLVAESDSVPPIGATIVDDTGRAVGNLTSWCDSPLLGASIGLGYVKTASWSPGSVVRIQWEVGELGATLSGLPFRVDVVEAG